MVVCGETVPYTSVGSKSPRFAETIVIALVEPPSNDARCSRMKIECDKCSAKYSIADEKVRGKTFKIRCKKCSNVIIVRDKAAADAGVLGGDEGAAATGWHLAINGETVGPMPEDDVRQRFRAGEIDRDTAVWQEGFEDWVPLGDVDTFADLASSAGHAAADPFASANQEDYAAAQAQAQAQAHAHMHGGAAVAASPVSAPVSARGGGMAVAESSPRVTRLTGQRNENSVLFSLDSLQALATGGGGGGPSGGAARSAAPSRQGPRGLATVAPSSEGSGLIDIRALGAMVGSDAAPTHSSGGASSKSVDDSTLPSFGGANLGGLASTPLTPQVAAVDHHHMAASQPQRSNAPLYVLMVLLLLGIVGLGAFVALRKPEQVIVEKTVPGEPAPSVKGGADDEDDKDKDKDKDKDDKDKDEAGAAKDEEGEKDEGEAAEGEDKAEGGDEKGTDPAGKSPTKKPSSSSSSKPSSSSSSSKPSTPTTTKPTPAPSSSSLDVDCILDPNLPKCKGGSSSKPGTPKPTPAPADPSLPDTLTTSDIKAGVTPMKDAAKSCGAKHGASPGEKVKVKLSIAGATGNVTSAAAEPPHQGTPLGNCVAAALKKAHFKKFKKPSLGAVYPVSM